MYFTANHNNYTKSCIWSDSYVAVVFGKHKVHDNYDQTTS